MRTVAQVRVHPVRPQVAHCILVRTARAADESCLVTEMIRTRLLTAASELLGTSNNRSERVAGGNRRSAGSGMYKRYMSIPGTAGRRQAHAQ